MNTKRLYLIILMLVIVCQQTGIGQDEPTLSTIANTTTAETQTDEQLEINRDALLTNQNEAIRIKAATVMLTRDNPIYREAILNVLGLTTNSMARMAVCKAIIQTRSSTEPIKNIDDFIEPLLGILSSEITAEAQVAAEATLIFEYSKIGPLLEKMSIDTSLPVRTRLNAIQALKRRSDMMATIKIIKLVDDPEKQIAEAAENALHSIGMPIGKDAETRRQIIYELQRKGKYEFLREWLIRQEEQIRRMRIDLSLWQKKYLTALSTIYANTNDDTARGNLLAEHLSGTEVITKLWAIEQVSQWIKSTNPKLPTELEPVLVNLITDPDKEVRLKTARLLSLMVQLDSAQRLLTQLEAETEDQVKTELLVALGGRCSYALLPSSPVQISPEVRKQALEWAKKYLFEEEVAKAQKGAEVMKKLLEPAGLTPEELDTYLGLLVERYKKQDQPNGTLRGELLSTMAGLCIQGSACRDKAIELFKPLFVEALGDKTDFVRETAVDGLRYIDKASALERLRNDFIDDPSITLRKKLIEMASEAGGKDDLTWLSKKIGSNSESGPAWLAMLKIFNSSDSSILNEWTDKLISQNSKVRLSDEDKISFLKIAETKATSENKLAFLKSVREKLAELYYKTGQFDRAADYLDNLYKSAQTDKERNAIQPNLLGAYLRGSKLEPAAKLIAECLAKEDLGPENAILVSIDGFLNEPTGSDPNAVLKILREIKPPSSRPNWAQWLKNWTDRLSKGKETTKTEEATKS